MILESLPLFWGQFLGDERLVCHCILDSRQFRWILTIVPVLKVARADVLNLFSCQRLGCFGRHVTRGEDIDTRVAAPRRLRILLLCLCKLLPFR